MKSKSKTKFQKKKNNKIHKHHFEYRIKSTMNKVLNERNWIIWKFSGKQSQKYDIEWCEIRMGATMKKGRHSVDDDTSYTPSAMLQKTDA